MRIPRDALPLLLYAAAAGLFYGNTGDRSFFPLHSRELSPWAGSTEPSEREALRETSIHGLADKAWMFHPLVVEGARAIREGELPLWTHRASCGMPLVGVGVSGPLYPPHLVFALGDPLRLYGLLAAFHAFAAAALTYAFLRRVGLGRTSAFLGGMLFGFGGWHLLRAHYFQIAASGTWLPLVLLSIESLARGRRRAWILAGGAGLALSFLSGFPQVALLTAEVAAAYALVRLVGLRRAQRGAAPRRFALEGAATLAVGGLLAAPAIWGGLEFSRRTAREEGALEVLRAQSLAPAHLLSFVVPDLVGDPVRWKDAEPPATRVPLLARLLVPPVRFDEETLLGIPFSLFETSAYLGIVPLLLLLLAWPRRRPPFGFFAAAGTIALLGAMRSPLLALLRFVPGFSLGAPARLLFVVAFCGAALAAAALDRILVHASWRPPRARLGLALAGLAIAAGAAGFLSVGEARAAGERLFTSGPALARASALQGRTVTREEALAAVSPDEFASNARDLRRQAARLALFLGIALAAIRAPGPTRGGAIVLAALLDLLSFGRPLAATVPAEGLFEEPAILAPIDDADEPARVFRVEAPYALSPQIPALYGLEDAGGYHPSLRTYEGFLSLFDAEALTRGVGCPSLTRFPGSPLFRLLGVRWLLVPSARVADWTPSPAIPAMEVAAVDERSGLSLLRLSDVLPRAFVAGDAQWAGDEAGVRARLLDPGFDPAREVVLLGAGDAGGEPAHHPARIARRTVSSVEVELPGAEGWLVLLESGYPGWQARVDGERRDVLAADLHFRAVRVHARDRLARFEFRPRSGRMGGVLAVAGLLLGAALSFTRRPPS